MSKVLIVFYKEMQERYQPVIEQLREYFSEISCDLEELCAGDSISPEECRIALTNTHADYICTLDLPCFELPTLLESSLYNILPAKQIHIVIDTKKLLVYRDRDFALNLFVCVPDTGRQWEREFANIPNLILYPPFELQNTQEHKMIRETIRNILDEVRKECEI